MDKGTWLFLLEIVVFSGAALAFGFWQLWDVKREQKKDRERKAAEREADGNANDPPSD